MPELIQPPIGRYVLLWYGARAYTAKVVKHGKKFCRVEFKLKSGREMAGTACIFPDKTPSSYQVPGAWFATYNPDSFANKGD